MKLIQLAITYVFYTQISVKQSFHKAPIALAELYVYVYGP